MAKRRNPKGSFTFDVGFTLEGPPEITPAVQDATNEMMRLEERIPKAALDSLKNTGNALGQLQGRIVAPIESQLMAANEAVKSLGDKLDATVTGLVGQAAETAAILEGISPPPAIIPAENVTPAAGIPATTEAGGGVLQFGPPGGGVPPPLRDVFPPIAQPIVPPRGIQPGVGVVPPVAGGGGWSVYCCCDTGKLEVFGPGKPPRMRGDIPGKEGPCYLVTVANSEQEALDWIRRLEADEFMGGGKLVKSICCVKGEWQGGKCFGAPAQPQPQPPPPPKQGPTPPYTPPCPPPPKPPPPPGTCPEPEVKWCVSRNSIECRAIAHAEDKPPTGTGWSLVVCGLKEYEAYNRAAEEDKDAKDKCKPTHRAPRDPVAPVLADPMCDPLAYCEYVTGAPLEGGGGPTSDSPGLAGIFGEDLERAEEEAGFIGSIVGGFVGGVFAVIGRMLKLADKYAGTSIWPKCAKQGALIRAHLQLSAVDWLTLLFGGSFRRIGKPSQYIAQASCPMIFPGIADATAAYLGNTIEKSTWECWVAMQDNCVAPLEKVVEARSTRYSIDDGLELFRQRYISESELREVYRNNGVIDEKLVDGMVLTKRQKFAPAELVRLVQRDLMSDSEARDELRRHGFGYGKDVEQVFDLATPVFDLNTTVQLWLREKLNDDEFEKALFALGYVRKNAVEQIKELSNVLPPYSDLVRMMVRDSANDKVVGKFGLDDLFSDAFKGELAEWAKKQGVSEKVMQYLWRAHWSIPSPTQLAEFWRRFRHGGGPGGAAVTLDMIETALAQQDILPFWQPWFIASQFNPLTRVDAKRAYQLGALDLDGIRKSFYERGYSDENAEILTEYTRREYIDKLRKSPLVKAAAGLKITPAELRGQLAEMGVPPDIQAELVERALDMLKAATRADCTKNLAKRFMVGDYTAADAKAELVKIGHDPRFADEAVDGWVCRLRTKSKEVTAAQLCRWLELGIIDAVTMVRRLEILGWRTADATAIAADCQVKLTTKAFKEQRAAAEKMRRELEKAAKDAARGVEKQRKEYIKEQKAIEAAKAAQDRRDKVLVKSAKVYADRNNYDISETYLRFQTLRANLKTTYALNDDESNQAVVLAVEGSPGDDVELIEYRADELAQSFANKEAPPDGKSPSK